MTSADQYRFLARLRRALGHDAGTRRRWSQGLRPQDADRRRTLVKKITGRSRAERLDLLDLLVDRCQQSNIGLHIADQIQEGARSIAELEQNLNSDGEAPGDIILWRHPLLEKLNLTGRLTKEEVTVTRSGVTLHRSEPDFAGEDRQRGMFRRQVVSAGIGITSADYCLADSATLVMKTRPARPRAVSLVPPVHVAVITLEEILLDLQELYAVLGDLVDNEGEGITNCMTFISGPSTTRDIEAIPVSGAQGPRELHIVVIVDGSR